MKFIADFLAWIGAVFFFVLICAVAFKFLFLM
jgi:hypothetical protein